MCAIVLILLPETSSHNTPPLWHIFWKGGYEYLSDQKWTFGITNETSDLVETGTQKRETKGKRDLMKRKLCWLKRPQEKGTKLKEEENQSERETSQETSKIQRSGHWVSRKDAVRCSRGLWYAIYWTYDATALDTGKFGSLEKAIVWGSEAICQFSNSSSYTICGFNLRWSMVICTANIPKRFSSF